MLRFPPKAMIAPNEMSMMGGGEVSDDAEESAETPESPMLNVTGDLAAALTDGRQAGDEFTATVNFRVANVGEDGSATLEVVDATPQEPMGDQDGAQAVDSYLAAKTPPLAQ